MVIHVQNVYSYGSIVPIYSPESEFTLISRNSWPFIWYHTMHDEIPYPLSRMLGVFTQWVYSLKAASPFPHIQEEATLFQGVTTCDILG